MKRKNKTGGKWGEILQSWPAKALPELLEASDCNFITHWVFLLVQFCLF